MVLFGVHDLSIAFRRTVFHKDRVPQWIKQLRVMVQGFIPFDLFGSQAAEVILRETDHKEGSGDHIIVPQRSVEGQSLQLAFVIADDTGIILPGIHAFDETPDHSLFRFQALFDFCFPGILPRLDNQHFQSSTTSLLWFNNRSTLIFPLLQPRSAPPPIRRHKLPMSKGVFLFVAHTRSPPA